MARSLLLGNGRLLLNFDDRYWIRDIYWPRIGIENHSEGFPFRLGVWADGATVWSDEWEREIRYEHGTLVGDVTLRHRQLALEVRVRDAVDYEVDVLCRRFAVRDLSGRARRVRVFLHHDFHIRGSDVGDTALYDPEIGSLIHYKVDRYFLVGGGMAPDYRLSGWATGKKRFGGSEGTWRDADEDGLLSRNPIAQGAVDSTIALEVEVPPGGEAVTYAWLAAAERYGHLLRINTQIRQIGPQRLIERTAAYWRLWLRKHEADFASLPQELVDLYHRSLLVMRLHVDSGGAIIAAADSDITDFARDTYTYMWPRDGALVADAFDRAGYPAVTRSFYDFAGRLLKKEGYFLHKYHPDRSLASSWHPWVDERGRKILPMQEDETGLVVWALWRHFERWQEVEEVQPLYRPFVLRAAEFMTDYRDRGTGLPLPSWDLWEERRGVITFTCAAVWAGLDAAARFAFSFGDRGLGLRYGRAADEVRQGMLDHLWDAERGRFLRMLVPADPDAGTGEVRDATVDASLFGLHFLGFLPPTDRRLRATLQAVVDGLTVHTEVGGLARYHGDYYHAVTQDWDRVPGNPWFVAVCWLARWRIAAAETPAEVEDAMRTLEWVARRATPAGLLPEQLHPFTGAPLAVTPLVWSHAALVSAIQEYLRRRAGDAAGDGAAAALPRRRGRSRPPPPVEP